MNNAQHGENPMNTNEVIILARKNATNDSARLCLSDAVELQAAGKLDDAKRRALDSLKHSVGVFHADFKRAVK